jgi:hypothetical protein
MDDFFKTIKVFLLVFTLLLSSEIETDPVKTFKLTGSIKEHFYLNVNMNDGQNARIIFNDVKKSHFEKGYVETQAAVSIREIRSNYPVWLKIKNIGWKLPSSYDKVKGPKRKGGSGQDFLLKVQSSTISTDKGVIVPAAQFGDSYGAVGAKARSILRIGEVAGGGVRRGVTGGSVDIDAKILLDPMYDAPGDYTIELELTVAAQ